MTYAEKLKDPRWQRKRLEVFQRDNFRCKHCYSDQKTLHVHHLIYLSGKEPWEYDISYLLTLCFECHEELEQSQVEQCEAMINLFKLRLHDSFVRKCAVDVFQRTDNLHDIIYLLWECINSKREGDVMNALQTIFQEEKDKITRKMEEDRKKDLNDEQ